MRLLNGTLIYSACVFIAASGVATAEPLNFRLLDPPIGLNAQEPGLFATADGRLLLSWTEPSIDGFAVKMATLSDAEWGDAHTVTQSDKIFVNWADFPSIAAFTDGTFAVQWLQESDQSSYNYDVNIALSKDDGFTWSKPLTPHQDGTQSQHGFVSMLPINDTTLQSVWLDGRAYGKNILDRTDESLLDAMQLRTTEIRSDGVLVKDTLLDEQTCTCCQTSATATADGTVLIAYRDKTDADIRDIAVVRKVDGDWLPSNIVYRDGWEISGCPVNGPAIDAMGQTAVVAWFTGANDVPVVKLAFSRDNGANFDAPLRIDFGEAVGRVDVMMLTESSALVTWVEWQKDDEVIFACKLDLGAPCEDAQIVTVNSGDGSVNFPRMARTPEGIYIAWTQPATEANSDPNAESTINLAFAPL